MQSELTAPPCPVCANTVTARVREVPTRRTKRMIHLNGCFACRSFWNPSDYRESDQQLAKDLDWGISVADRNKNAGRRLFEKLKANGVTARHIVEVGCGIGTLLQVALQLGMKVTGYDVNGLAIEYARASGINAHAGFWTAETPIDPADLFLSISVLEHISEPRPLLQNLCTATKAHNAALFVSVPFLDRPQWPFIGDPDPYKPGTPFLDNDVHVTHFSREGLEAALREFGLTKLTFVEGGLWNGFLGRA